MKPDYDYNQAYTQYEINKKRYENKTKELERKQKHLEREEAELYFYSGCFFLALIIGFTISLILYYLGVI